MAKAAQPIKCDATVYKVQTLVDGGIRITIDLPETAIESAAKLMACQVAGVILEIVATVKPE
jgi:hypothetical protein